MKNKLKEKLQLLESLFWCIIGLLMLVGTMIGAFELLDNFCRIINLK